MQEYQDRTYAFLSLSWQGWSPFCTYDPASAKRHPHRHRGTPMIKASPQNVKWRAQKFCRCADWRGDVIN